VNDDRDASDGSWKIWIISGSILIAVLGLFVLLAWLSSRSESEPYAVNEVSATPTEVASSSDTSDEPYSLPHTADTSSYLSALRQLDPVLNEESDSWLLQLGTTACSILDTGASTADAIDVMMVPSDAYEGQTTARIVVGADRYLC